MLGWSIEMGNADHSRRRLEEVRGFIDGLYGHDLHAKRVDGLAGATLGVMAGASLAVAVIGQALAQARGLVTKHAAKQVDRPLGNGGKPGCSPAATRAEPIGQRSRRWSRPAS